MSINKLLAEVKTNSSPASNIGNLMMEQKFAKLFILMRNERNLEEVRAGLHATSIIAPESEFCLRQQVLSLLFAQSQGEELPVKALQIFAAGNSIHEKWQNMLLQCTNMEGNAIRLIRNEARSFDERYELYYTPDSIVEINDTIYIVEYKSMNTFAYQHAIKSSNPHPSARKQLQLYMFLTGLSNGLILIEDKNTQEFLIYKVEANYTEVLPYIDRLSEVQAAKQEYLEYKVLPNKKCKNQYSSRAKRCNMQEACFNIGKGRILL